MQGFDLRRPRNQGISPNSIRPRPGWEVLQTVYALAASQLSPRRRFTQALCGIVRSGPTNHGKLSHHTANGETFLSPVLGAVATAQTEIAPLLWLPPPIGYIMTAIDICL